VSGRVFVFGSINTDLVVYVTRLPQPGETVSGTGWASFPGGKGANQAVAAARAGARVELYGCLGDDLFGRERLKSLDDTGVSTGGVRVLPGVSSGVAQITVDAEGENTIAVAPGANMSFSAGGISLPSPPKGETWVSLFQNEVPQEATEELIRIAHEAGHMVLWNLAPTLSRPPAVAALSAVDYLICNRNELTALTGSRGDPEQAARALVADGVHAVIVTLGKEGSLLIAGQAVRRVDAFHVNAVDTVGAGDCFCGVLAASMAGGMEVEAALRRASAAAAISTTRRGAQPSMPSGREIGELLREKGVRL
jgi:ribokinase